MNLEKYVAKISMMGGAEIAHFEQHIFTVKSEMKKDDFDHLSAAITARRDLLKETNVADAMIANGEIKVTGGW